MHRWILAGLIALSGCREPKPVEPLLRDVLTTTIVVEAAPPSAKQTRRQP